MAYNIRGEVAIESGLGLPRLTTLQRLAYTPPKDGYVVFDTDLKRACVWDATGVVWVVQSSADQAAGKITALDGVAVNSLTLQTAGNVDAIKFSGGVGGTQSEPSDGVNFIISSISGSNPINATLSNNNRTVISTISPFRQNAIKTSADTIKSSGKWYWETAIASAGAPNIGILNGAANHFGFSNFSLTYIGDSTNSLGFFMNSGDVRYGGATLGIIAALAGFDVPGDIVRHRLDMDNNTYEVSLNDSEVWTALTDTQPVPWASAGPTAMAGQQGGQTFSMRGFEQTYKAPTGYATFDGTSAPSKGIHEFFSGGITSKLSGDDENFEIAYDGTTTTIELNATHALTNQPIRGVDEANSTSYVTKAYVDGFVVDGEYEATFVAGDWSAGTLTITQATHGIPHTAGTSYTVVVQELVVGEYCTVSIETEVSSINGDVILKSAGSAFTGRIFIS
jgi:hypothetical protein